MNSSDEPQHSGTTSDKVPSSEQIQNSDSNANVNLVRDESKGAIPKTKFMKQASKKTNNNVDEPYGNNVVINGFFRKGTSNYLDYSDSDQENDTLDVSQPSHSRSKINFEGTSLNIPVENDFLMDTYVPLNPSDFADLKHSSTSCHQEPNVKDSDSSSDDTELLSLSDDGCIYTYKGDQVADLPSSFFNFEIPPLEDIPGDTREVTSSPEMDFLEMDFDPGPSGDADSESESNAEIDNAASLPLDSEKVEKEDESLPFCCSKDMNKENNSDLNQDDNTNKNKNVDLTTESKENPVLLRNEIKMPWSCSYSDRTRTAKHLRIVKRHHSPQGEWSSPTESDDSNSANLTSFHNMMEKLSVNCKESEQGDVEKVKIWSNQEASLSQITQIGPSACGATAVLNVLKALRFPIPLPERIQECMSTRLRANSSPLTEYLLSRSVAGCTHRDIIKGLYELSDKKIYARFFAMYPERLVNLQLWLGYWIKNGAIPIATLNLQKCIGKIPDSWHHQMIYGVGPKGIYLTNPMECVDPNQLWPQLSSESELLVRVEDVVSRWNMKTDLSELMKIEDVRWRELNVVGQVARAIRDSKRVLHRDHVPKTYIRIPAEYKAGITLAIDINSPGFTMLRQCPELPLLQPEHAASAF